MKSALILFSLMGLFAGCDMLDTPKKMDDTLVEIRKSNRGIEETNESIRLQKLILSKDDMLKPENTEILKPVAIGMIAGAKKFGEAATTEELIEYVRVLELKIKKDLPEDSSRDENGKFPKAVAKQFDHQKQILLNQIYVIAGFAPQEKVDQIIDEQIYGGGLYQDTAYVFLMARVMFLGTYLQETLLAENTKTVKQMRETVNRLGSIDYILKLPFKENVKIDVDTFIADAPVHEALYDEEGKMGDAWNAPKLWKKVMKRFDQDLKDGNIVAGSKLEKAKVQNEIAELRAKVQEYLDSWK